MQVTVIGLGNILQQDDGAGVAAVQQLAAQAGRWPDALLIDGGTLGLELLSYVEDATHLLLLDAVITGAAPGTLVRLEGDAVPLQLSTKLSPHQAGVVDLLAAAYLQGRLPQQIVVLGVVPQQIAWGMQLTPVVEEQLAGLVAAAAGQLDRWTAQVPSRN